MKKMIESAGVFMLTGCLLLWCSSDHPNRIQKGADTEISNPSTSRQSGDRQTVQNDIDQSRQNAITRAVADVSPAIVGIKATVIRRYYQRDFFFEFFFREVIRPETSLGSGFLISSDGYLLTNQHVIENSQSIQVTLTGGTRYDARIIGQDETYDVALLKIDGSDFPYISLGNSDDVIIGEWVIALGNPFGLFDISSRPTVTVGVVSATEMNFGGTSQNDGRSYQHMIQTDASINSGNSGGPLVNSMGDCIGINTFIFTGSQNNIGSIGIGFAIPINRVKNILPDLKQIGYVDRSFKSGLVVDDIDFYNAARLGIRQGSGVIILKIVENSPADRAKLKKGDIIVAINGIQIRSTNDAERVTNTIDVREDPKMTVRIFRNGKEQEIELELK
jgi:serine protease Do